MCTQLASDPEEGVAADSRPASGLPRRILLVHGTLTLVIPYLHTRLRAHALSRAWPDAPSSDRRRKAWDVLTSLESTHTLLGLLSFVAFLWDGQCVLLLSRFDICLMTT